MPIREVHFTVLAPQNIRPVIDVHRSGLTDHDFFIGQPVLNDCRLGLDLVYGSSFSELLQGFGVWVKRGLTSDHLLTRHRKSFEVCELDNIALDSNNLDKTFTDFRELNLRLNHQRSRLSLCDEATGNLYILNFLRIRTQKLWQNIKSGSILLIGIR